ncbi:MAG TPA: DUF748 domain-containing protein [Steroidobacteraceae bacterium]|nr:DUF748 domain-containing protein [Steroidobacteraceae bacterium]
MHSRSRKVLIVLGAMVLLLVAARLAMPYAVERYVNGKLAALDAYRGHIGDVDIHLWRGAYSINAIRIEKIGASRPVPFFSADRLNLSVEWRSLMRGSMVSEAEFLGPELNLVQAKSKEDSQLGGEENWNARLEELFPFRFNTVQVVNGTIRFLAPGISTKDAITARHVHGSVTNLTNVLDSGKRTFADFQLAGDVLDGAPAKVKGSVDAFATQPTFDVNLEVKKVQLPQVNPWLREYIKADAEAGKFELYLELAASDGKFAGYAKPILQDVDLYRSNEEEQNPLRRLWEGFLDFAANALENKDADQVAARIPFSGTIKNPETSLFATISSVLRNAFVSAFARSLEGSITLRDVKKNLRDLGGEGAEKEKDSGKKDSSKESGDGEAKDDRDSAKPKPGPAGKT